MQRWHPVPWSQPQVQGPADPDRLLAPALTDDGMVAVRESGDERMRIGLPGSGVNLFVGGTWLPKTDVLHDGRSEQDWLLG